MLNHTPAVSPQFSGLGTCPQTRNGVSGWRFRLWAPEATAVSVTGSFNQWNPTADPMQRTPDGYWETFLHRPQLGDLYKYVITTRKDTKYWSDPWAWAMEPSPGCASQLCRWPVFPWADDPWLRFRHRKPLHTQPQLLYHLQPDAWRRTNTGNPLSCQALTAYLVPYLKKLGCTGVVLAANPDTLFAPPALFSLPKDLMYLVDQFHRAGLCAFLDWHPDHFSPACCTPFCLDWNQPEARACLTASVKFWLEEYHLDGLRINLVDPVLYLAGTGCDLLLQALEQMTAQCAPDAVLLLHSPAGVTHFSGWQEGSASPLLDLFQGKAESLSPQLIHGGLLSLPAPFFQAPHPGFIGCFSGTSQEQQAGARACYLMFLALPGQKLLSMGAELDQRTGWRTAVSLDWHLLTRTSSQAYHRFFQTANACYLTALWQPDRPVEWLSDPPGANGLAAFLRRCPGEPGILCLCNPTRQVISRAILRLPVVGTCHMLLSSDEKQFGGSGTSSVPSECSGSRLLVTLPPLTCVLMDYLPATRPDSSKNRPSDGLRSR